MNDSDALILPHRKSDASKPETVTVESKTVAKACSSRTVTVGRSLPSLGNCCYGNRKTTWLEPGHRRLTLLPSRNQSEGPGRRGASLVRGSERSEAV